MPGSNTQFSRNSVNLTGVRRPRHPGQIYGQAPRTLRPIALQPMRPGEVLDSVSLVGGMQFNSLCDLINAPLSYVEVGVWFIPMHAYGADFVNLFTTDAEDIVQRGTFGDIEGAPGDVINPLNSSGDGHSIAAGGLSQINRPWAGEIGDINDSGSTYVPYASHGAYIVGDTYYGLDTTLDFRDENLLQNPPLVSDWVRGASIQARDINIGLDNISASETSLTQLLENMYLMSTPDRTFPEILAGYGVDPARAAGMPVPILTEQIMMKKSDPHVLHGQSTGVSNFQNPDFLDHWSADRYGTNVSGSDADQGHVWNDRPYGFLGGAVNVNRGRNFRADTFGMLMTTSVVYTIFGTQDQNGHIFDATRLLNLGHWGDPSFGGMEEIDFITIQDIYNREGTTDETQQAMNLLNLYLHGDVFTEHGQNDEFGFAFRSPGGALLTGTNLDWAGQISTQFNIRTDMVGN